MVDVIAQEVRRYRQAQRMSAQHLADRCAELGLPIKRSVLANLESGRRETVTVPELLVMAAALSVPPLLLVYPVGRRETVEVIPGVEASPREAFGWAAGELAVGDLRDHSEVLRMYRDHDRMLSLVRMHGAEVRRSLTSAGPDAPEPDRRQAQENARDSDQLARTQVRELARLRAALRSADLLPPDLPADVEALIEEEASG